MMLFALVKVINYITEDE